MKKEYKFCSLGIMGLPTSQLSYNIGVDTILGTKVAIWKIVTAKYYDYKGPDVDTVYHVALDNTMLKTFDNLREARQHALMIAIAEDAKNFDASKEGTLQASYGPIRIDKEGNGEATFVVEGDK